jgi:hypothetical protein
MLLMGALAQRAEAGAVSWSAPIQTHAGANYLSCPSATQCTAITSSGTTYTFNPGSPGSAAASRKYLVYGITNGLYEGISGLTCLSVASCVAVDSGADELAFNPVTGTVSHDRELLHYGDFFGLYCFALSDCITASYNFGYYTFDGSSVDANPRAHSLPHKHLGYTALTCATRSECIAIVQNGGWESTFVPGKASTTGYRINRGSHLNGIACPSAAECVAVNSVGSVITFNPKRPRPITRAVDSHDLNGLACSSVTLCVAADRDGRVVYGKPGAAHWTVSSVPGAQRLETIAYAGSHRFVVVDSSGSAYVATIS